MPRRIFITVAEVSGDKHAAALIRSLKSMEPDVIIEGLGGPQMQSAGANLLHNTVTGAAMGWRGALRALEVARWMKQVRAHYQSNKPDLHICIDSSAMNLPFAKLAKSFGVPVLYYIAPQLWASREGRMNKLRRDVDAVASIVPFEEPYFRQHGVNATFVGHPLFDQISAPHARDGEARFPDHPPIVGVIPGSRKSEVKQNLPHLIEVAKRIRDEFPNARFLIPTTPAVHSTVLEFMEKHSGSSFLVHLNDNLPKARGPFTIKQDAFDEFVPQCDLCLTKSGTSTVHVAAYHVPMIVVYRINPILWHLAARWLIKTKKIAMVNILAGQIDLVPEFIPWYGSNEPVAKCAIDLLNHPEKLEEQRRKLRELMATLDKPGASMNAAKLAIELMDEK
ncbi:MAG TPA: lipid-A-disaccharide synthase [Tepidisphaeraceae bacterium]|nr:lipid-A-disaccharide synthase [Tepidisphaeraceae bacterium]